jgi:hypothetical protein
MNRSLRRVVAIALATTALVGAGCSSTLDDAARVGDARVPRDSFEAELRDLLRNTAFRDLLVEQGLTPAGERGRVSSEVTALWLGERIRQLAIDAEFEARGLEVDEALRASARSNIQAAFGGEEVFDRFSESLQRTLVEWSARAGAVTTDIAGEVDEPTDTDARDYYDANVQGLCESGRQVSHILVDTRAEADVVVAQLASGADFATLAAETSIDSGSAPGGGALGCLRDGAFVEEFQEAATAAPLGDPVGPVETEFGFHVVLASAFVPPTFDEAREQILELLHSEAESAAAQEAEAELAAALSARLGDDDVWVAPRYGTWVVDDGGSRVVPPESPDPRDGRGTSDATGG